MVNFGFVAGLLTFVGQSVLVGFLLEELSADGGGPYKAHIITSAVLVLAGTGILVAYVARMKRRFFEVAMVRLPEPTSTDSPAPQGRRGSYIGPAASAVSVANGNRGSTNTADAANLPLLDNPITVVLDHPDLAAADSQDSPNTTPTFSDFEFRGILRKHTQHRSELGSSSLRRQLSATINSATASEWRERYFELRDRTLQYWRSEADYMNAKPATTEEPIDLAGYHVLVDTSDPQWGFVLQPTTEDGRRTWSLRAPSEQERLEWARRLVIATMMHKQ